MPKIGTIHTAYQTIEDMLIQPKRTSEVKGYILLDNKYIDGLEDLTDWNGPDQA